MTERERGNAEAIRPNARNTECSSANVQGERAVTAQSSPPPQFLFLPLLLPAPPSLPPPFLPQKILLPLPLLM